MKVHYKHVLRKYLATIQINSYFKTTVAALFYIPTSILQGFLYIVIHTYLFVF